MVTKKINNKPFLVIELLQSMSKSELNRLEDFLSSPYFTKDKRPLKLLKFLKRNVLKGKRFDEAAQAIAYHLLVSSINNEKNIFTKKQKDYLYAKMSELHRLMQRFLAIEILSEHPVQEITLRNKQLLDKKQFRSIERLIKKEKKEITDYKKSIEHYELAFQIEKSQLNYLFKTGALTHRDNYAELNYNLDCFYLLNKLSFHSSMLSITDVIGKTYDFASIDAIKPLLALPQYANNPLIIIYNASIQLILTQDEVYYDRLLLLLEQNNSELPNAQQSDFYAVACNFCMTKLMKGQTNYNEILLNLYKLIHKKKLLMDEGYLQANKLKNIVALSCKLKDFDWAIGIVEEYHLFARKEVQRSIYHLNMGAIEFYRADYEKAREHFSIVSKQPKAFLFFDLDFKILLAKCYYEMDTEYLEYTKRYFLSIEKFVKSNKSLPLSTKESYKNFLLILLNCYRIRHKEGKKTLESVITKMKEMEYISNKVWLLEKIMALKE